MSKKIDETCIYCGGRLREGRTEHVFNETDKQGNRIRWTVSDIPCVKCRDCGAEAWSDEVHERVGDAPYIFAGLGFTFAEIKYEALPLGTLEN